MSATVNSDKFSQYFDGCPSLTIPGVIHPVTEYFLPDIYRLLDGTPTRIPTPPQSKRFKPSNHFAKAHSDSSHPEADVELVCETILHVCRNYGEV
ncbi:PREDICTED: ATP-dependent RNA helicase DHX36-like [Acropora digitifera]|uniref:ATP-dependent RNA helicase DHX36-like n=1 Tax=Acropora digitifera TaxID=70779 RepID=UPI00077B1746|nr:PREDICTED: ATP-dependent RNA helicase DHX36-like [Acropora digitifera]